MSKESQKPIAPIVLLYGTSTAGKSSICEELRKQDSALPPEQQLKWRETGNDLAQDKLFDSLIKEASSDSEREAYEKLTSSVSDIRDIFITIFSGQMPNRLAEELSSKPEEKETLWAVRDKHKSSLQGRANERIAQGAIEQIVFDGAIENSKNGIPTIIDALPGRDGSDTVAKFQGHLKERGFSGPSMVVVAHCPIPELSNRMDGRNRESEAKGDMGNIRKSMFPFEQYSQIFGAAKEGQEPIGKLARSDVESVAKKFGAIDYNTDALLEKLGFSEGVSEVNIAPKCNGMVVSAETRESTSEIANNIQGTALQHRAEFRQEQQRKTVDALDLATMAPILKEVRDKAADLGAEVSLKPPLGLDKESMAELNKIRGNLQEATREKPQEKSHTEKMVDMNLRSPKGSREI